MSAPERLIAFDTVFNFRDLGGYPAGGGRRVRWRRLFRADGLNRLRPADAERFAALGIATVVDLRTPTEAEASRFDLGDGGVVYHHLPMFDVMPDWDAGDPDADGYLAERYVDMLVTGEAALVATLELLADEASYPLVFHCAAGKDRTGIVAAITLSLLGVPDEVIIADYAASHEAMERLMGWAREQPGAFTRPAHPVPSAAVAAHPTTMTRFLELIRARDGSVEGLVARLGVDATVSERLRSLLLE
jgi:protein-tyrosine phosphatase